MSIRIYAKDKSVSYRVSRYWWQGKAYLTLTGQLLIDTRTGQSLPDRVLWEHTAKELRLIQPGTSFDQGKAKVKAEFFVGGYAFAYDEHTAISSVQVEIGQLKKTAAVYGDRFWLKSGPLYSMSAPLTFKQVALSWTNAFGGKACPLNPKGKGQGPNEQDLWPLANIEDPYHIIDKPHQITEPMGFLPTHLNPQQRERLGTFDEQWLKTAWPYLPQDHDMHYWNAAAQDQQQTGFWTGTEQITCTHLHPTKPVLHFTLQQQKIRAFYQKKNQSPQEMSLDFDTIWLFPHVEQALLIWHGTIPVCDETAFDIEAMLLAEENLQTGTLPFDYYVELLNDKIQRKPPPLVAKEPKPPVKREPNPEIQKKMAEHKAKLAARMQQSQAKQAQAQQQMDDMLRQKLTPEHYALYQKAKADGPAEPPIRYDRTLSSEENTKKMHDVIEQHMTPEMKKHWLAHKDQPVEPPDFEALKTKFSETLAKVPAADMDADTREKLLASVDTAKMRYEQQQQRLAKPRPVKLSQQEAIDQALQEKCFKNMLICDQRFEHQNFDGVDFTQVRFKNCHFRHCTFHRCALHDVSFNDCSIEQSHFNMTTFTQLRWHTVTLKDNIFADCGFDKWRAIQNTCQRNTFERCLFKNGRAQDSQWLTCQFKQCQDSNSHYKKSCFNETTWQDCDVTRIYIDYCSLQHSEYDHSRLQGVSFEHSDLLQVHFQTCHSKSFTFDHCQLTKMSFQHVNMPNLTVRDCEWSGWQVVDSDFSKLLCTRSALIDLEFVQSNFYNSRYKTLTRFDNIQFQHVNLQTSFFEGVPLQYSQIHHCDLTQSIWHRCQIDNGEFSANVATLSRFEDCTFTRTQLIHNNYFQGSFKRSLFKQTDIADCNLVRVNFYHASSDQLTLQRCLLPDPLPVGFWERWQGVSHE